MTRSGISRVFLVGICTSLLLLLVSNVNGMDFKNFGMKCEKFSCPKKQKKTHTVVPKKNFEFTVNGCGTAGMTIISKSGVDLSECCNWHDACYSVCGIKKATCEKRFEKCLNDLCKAQQDAETKEECDSGAKIMHLGANMLGCTAFQSAQKEACTCVPKDQEKQALKDRLIHFLKANKAPEKDLSDTNLDQLLEKYQGKESKMFHKLLYKYPNARKMDKSKGNFMDEVFAEPGAGRAGAGAGAPPPRPEDYAYETTKPSGKFTVGEIKTNDDAQEEEEEVALEDDDDSTVKDDTKNKKKKDKFYVGTVNEDGEEGEEASTHEEL